MRKYFKTLENWFLEEMSKVKVKALNLTNSWLSENQIIKELKILRKLYIYELERKWNLLI